MSTQALDSKNCPEGRARSTSSNGLPSPTVQSVNSRVASPTTSTPRPPAWVTGGISCPHYHCNQQQQAREFAQDFAGREEFAGREFVPQEFAPQDLAAAPPKELVPLPHLLKLQQQQQQQQAEEPFYPQPHYPQQQHPLYPLYPQAPSLWQRHVDIIDGQGRTSSADGAYLNYAVDGTTKICHTAEDVAQARLGGNSSTQEAVPTVLDRAVVRRRRRRTKKQGCCAC